MSHTTQSQVTALRITQAALTRYQARHAAFMADEAIKAARMVLAAYDAKDAPVSFTAGRVSQ